MQLALAFAVTLRLAAPALALGQPETCDMAALAAAEAHGVPPQLMLAITRVETGRNRAGALQPWPWAVNQAGQSHWFDTAEAAEDFVRRAMGEGMSNIDIGCFQINLRWHGLAFSSLQSMFDPTQNAEYAARFLAENHRRKGNWVDAVAAYHSETPAHAAAYVERVEAVLTRLASGDTVPSSPTPPTAVPRDNRFPLLQPGSGATMASLVPAGQLATPLFAPDP